MTLKYKCLILDHDDTAVDSTAKIHYPAHLDIMQRLRPNHTPISLDGWFEKNFNPGIFEYLTEELCFTQQEMKIEYDIWRNYTQSIIPPFFDGFLELLIDYKQAGGIITVVSHSDVDIIQKHYTHHSNGHRIEPELIFGWDQDQTKRKPHPYPATSILENLNLQPEQALIVDDLKPGITMGQAVGIPVAGAGWSHQIPTIKEDMINCCDFYFTTVADFKKFLF